MCPHVITVSLVHWLTIVLDSFRLKAKTEDLLAKFYMLNGFLKLTRKLFTKTAWLNNINTFDLSQSIRQEIRAKAFVYQ